MNGTLKLAGLILGAWAATGASRQSLAVGETLLFSPPRDFRVGYQINRDNRFLTEYIPVGQTVEDWTEMLTVQVFRGATVDALTFLRDVARRYMNACPGTTGKGIFTGQVNGYAMSMLLLKCPNNPSTGKPETTVFRVIKGTDALYSVQHAWRAVPSAQQIDEAMHALVGVTVCDSRTPSHPCPSLDSLTPHN